MPAAQANSHSAISQRYDVKETIGAGGFAKVKAGKHKVTGQLVAIKIMDKAGLGEDLPRAYREIETLKKLRHQHICQLYEVVETGDKLYMIMEHAPGGELFDYIVAKDRLKEPEARKFFRQITSAVAYVHSKGFAHRDLKPENLLLDDKQNIKLIDFGLVANPSKLDNPLKTCCGSPAYAAPELIQGDPYLGTEADVWSMGILLYALLCGFLPFDHDNTAYLYRLIQRAKYDEPKWLSEGSKLLLSKLIVKNPNRRLTVEDLIRHPWMNIEAKRQLVWSSIYEEGLDSAVLEEMSRGYGRPVDEIAEELRKWKFDGMTATYFLLLQAKAKGKPVVMKKAVTALGPKRPMTPDRPRSPAAVHRVRLGSVDMYSSVESLPGSDNEEVSSSSLPPLTPPAKQRPPFIAVPTAGGGAESLKVPNGTLRLSGSSSGGSNLVSPPTPTVTVLTKFLVKTNEGPVRQRSPSADVGLELYSKSEQPPKSQSFMAANNDDVFGSTKDSRLTPEAAGPLRARAQSIDTRLDAIGRAESHPPTTNPSAPVRAATLARDSAPSYATPTARRKNPISGSTGKLSGSLTNLFSKLGSRKEPRKIKGLYNFETTSTKPASQVLSEVVRVLQEKKITYKMKGYVLRCKLLDDRKKPTLEFDLEICQLPQLDMIGIHRKRLKGDTFAFKRACEDILHAIHI